MSQELKNEIKRLFDVTPEDVNSVSYGFKFKNYHKRLDAVEQWEKERDPLSVKKSDTKKPKLTIIKDNDWMKSYKGELSPSQALERFYKLKTEEKRQRLLEEVRNVELLW